MASNGDFLDDAASFRALIQTLPPKDRVEYEGYGALSMESCFPNRRFVVYTLIDGKPTNISLLLCEDMEMTRIGGPTITVTDEKGSVVVGVKPHRWRGRDLFLHVPQNFVLKWTGKLTDKGVHFAPHYAILMKTRSKEYRQVSGDTYCTTMNKFKQRFPDVTVRY